MRYPKAFCLLIISLALVLICACEKDSVTPERLLGDWHFEGIYIGPTWGEPSIAGTPNLNKMVICHVYADRIYYLVGTVNSDHSSVNWSGNQEWSDSMRGDGAISPQATVSDNGVVMCAFQTCYYNGQPAGEIWVGFGTISGDSIDWKGMSYAGISGYYPSIAITRDGKYAVLVFQGAEKGGNLYYAVTPVDTNSNSLQWGGYSVIGLGYRPCIAMNDQDQVVLVLNSYQSNDGLFYKTGQFHRESSTVSTGGTYSFGASDNTTHCRPIVTMGDFAYGSTSVFALAPLSSEYVPGYERFYAGNLNQSGHLDWGGSVVIGSDITSASIGVGYGETTVETYEDAINASKMYYFVIGNTGL
jgi:hypothetical protein